MTHPYREELAGRLPGDLSERLEAIASALPNSGLWDQSVATLREAVAALRQSPTAEEVAEVIGDVPATMTEDVRDCLSAGAIQRIAEGVDRLYRGSKE